MTRHLLFRLFLLLLLIIPASGPLHADVERRESHISKAIAGARARSADFRHKKALGRNWAEGAYKPKKPINFNTLGFVFGLAADVLFGIGIFSYVPLATVLVISGLIVGLAGIVFSIIGLAKRSPHKWEGILGLIASGLPFAISVAFYVIALFILFFVW